jgi:peptidoglycan hydrolase-like protein with peptidoglycan-binding domain/cell wall-associated NlpC family hydrolase
MMTGKLGTFYASTGSLTKAERQANAEYIRRFFASLGWPLPAICGVLGNMQRESGMNPGRWQSGKVKDSSGYGLVQWTPSTNFRSWAAAQAPPQDELMDGQLAKIRDEHDTGKQFFSTKEYPLTFRQFAACAESPVEKWSAPYYLARVFGRNYERSAAILAGGAAAEKSLDARGKAAEEWYAYLKGEAPLKKTRNRIMIEFMRAQVGEPYIHGHHGPDEWDCSGLIMEAAKLAGFHWEHSSDSQWYENIKPTGDFIRYGKLDTIPRKEDILLFHYGKRTNGEMGMVHVAMVDGETDSVLQAGGYLGHGVHENPYEDCEPYFTHWAAVRGGEDEIEVSVEPASPSMPTLRRGDSGEAVITLQKLLNANGANLATDGTFGQLTASAVEWYQRGHGLTVDGVVGPKTWASLLPVEPQKPQEAALPTLRVGSQGAYVITLQNLLNQSENGGHNLKVDGKFGPKTQIAVKLYQRDHGLVVDGTVGPATWTKLTEA